MRRKKRDEEVEEGEGRWEERRQERREEVSRRTKDAQTDGAPEEVRCENKEDTLETWGWERLNQRLECSPEACVFQGGRCEEQTPSRLTSSTWSSSSR